MDKNLIKFTPFMAAGAFLLFASAVSAQIVTIGADRADLTQQQTQSVYGPGFVDGHAVQTPNDADIGSQEILRSEAQYQPFTFSIGTPVFYTSNVALTPNHVRGDVVFAPVVAFFYDPQIIGNLYAHAGAREQVFYYGKYSAFNFGSLDCEAGLTYYMPQLHNAVLRAWYDFNRLTLDDRLGDEFFSDHRIILNAEVPFKFGDSQILSIGGDVDLSVGADHQSPRRNDYDVYVAYGIGLTRNFSIGAVGRVVVRDYHQNGRTDVSEMISGNATYRFTNWVSVSAIGSFAHSDSNQDRFDYDVGDLGGALQLTVKF